MAKKTTAFLQKHALAFFTIGLIVGVVLAAGYFLGSGADLGAQMWDPNRDLPDSLEEQNADSDLRSLILKVINWALGFVGLVAVIMCIYGGYLILASSGNDEQVGKGKNVIIYGIVGVIVILFSYAIVNTVFTVTTGSDVNGGGGTF